MTIEDLNTVNATLMWINLKSGVLPAVSDLQSTHQSVPKSKDPPVLHAVGKGAHLTYTGSPRMWIKLKLARWSRAQAPAGEVRIRALPRLRVISSSAASARDSKI
jgi:hypothetical protein